MDRHAVTDVVRMAGSQRILVRQVAGKEVVMCMTQLSMLVTCQVPTQGTALVVVTGRTSLLASPAALTITFHVKKSGHLCKPQYQGLLFC
jgi:NAD(P)H-hydrate repair Nnr-like enzyme with NAD(P)H-hydrate epimerase domain